MSSCFMRLSFRNSEQKHAVDTRQAPLPASPCSNFPDWCWREVSVCALEAMVQDLTYRQLTGPSVGLPSCTRINKKVSSFYPVMQRCDTAPAQLRVLTAEK